MKAILCIGAGLGLLVGAVGPVGAQSVQDKLDTIIRQQRDAELQRQIDETNRRNREANQRTEDELERTNHRAFCRNMRQLHQRNVSCPEND